MKNIKHETILLFCQIYVEHFLALCNQEVWQESQLFIQQPFSERGRLTSESVSHFSF